MTSSPVPDAVETDAVCPVCQSPWQQPVAIVGRDLEPAAGADPTVMLWRTYDLTVRVTGTPTHCRLHLLDDPAVTRVVWDHRVDSWVPGHAVRIGGRLRRGPFYAWLGVPTDLTAQQALDAYHERDPEVEWVGFLGE